MRDLRIVEQTEQQRAERVQGALAKSVDGMKHDLAKTATLQEAWAYYMALRPLAQEMNDLVDVAATRVETFLERLR